MQDSRHHDISRIAYLLWDSRDSYPGALNDWLTAERVYDKAICEHRDYVMVPISEGDPVRLELSKRADSKP